MIIVGVFPSGSLVSYEVCKSLLHDKKVDGVIGITSNSHGNDVTDVESFNKVVYDSPSIYSDKKSWDDFLPKLGLTHIIFTTDTSIHWAANNTELWGTIKAMIPTLDICDVILNKRKTYERWPAISPLLYPNDDVSRWYEKPSIGHSSIGCRYISKSENLKELSKNANNIICEGIDECEDEYTVECYGSELIGVRRRDIIVNGLSMCSSKSKLTDRVRYVFDIIVKFMGDYDGPWFFQLKGGKLLEIQARIPGAGSSYRLFHGQNVITRWIYGNSPKPHNVVPVVRSLKVHTTRVTLDTSMRVSGIAVDWDDTLRLGTTKIRHELLGSLYSVYNKIPIVLLTKHSGDLLQSLHNCGVSTSLFSRIIQISATNKCDVVGLENYILVDDSCSERNLWHYYAIDPVSAVPIINALAEREMITGSEKCKARHTDYTTRSIDGKKLGWIIRDKPSAFDELQLGRLRYHVTKCRNMLWEKVSDKVKHVLDIGPDINPWSQDDRVVVDTLDLPGSNTTLVGDLTMYVPNSDERYDMVSCTEVIEHCSHPWSVPESLWKMIKPGGYLLVTVPFNFRLHGPQPDGYRFSPEGVRQMFQPWFSEVIFISVLDTPGSPLSPTHIGIAFKKETMVPRRIPWALEKGVSGMVEPVKNLQFSNGGRLVRKLERDWLSRMNLSEDEYEAVSCCNGTIGLDALSKLYEPDMWYVQNNSFVSDVQGNLASATVVQMRVDGRCGPVDVPDGCGLIVTSCFGMMTVDHQKEYLKRDGIVIFDHAAVVDPSKYVIGDGAMFSLHETKPLGRGEGGIIVVPKSKGVELRGLLSFGRPYRKSTNGKMSEISAHYILTWWNNWDTFVYEKFKHKVFELYDLVASTPHIEWMFPEEMKTKSVIPACFAVHVPSSYNIDNLQTITRLPVRKYYEPLDGIQNENYDRSLVMPVKPYVDIKEYIQVLDFFK